MTVNSNKITHIYSIYYVVLLNLHDSFKIQF